MATATKSKLGRPDWYSQEDDTAWERIKGAFQRDWQQTKHDLGGNEPDLDQQVGDTVSQAIGTESIPPANSKTPHPNRASSDEYNEADESAYRYGYAASRHYGLDRDWDDETESTLRREWGDENDWERTRAAIRRGWNYSRSESLPRKAK